MPTNTKSRKRERGRLILAALMVFPSRLKQAAAAWMDDNVMRLSAALSFYTFLSLAPLLIISVEIANLAWGGHGSASERITRQMSDFIGSPGAQTISPMMSSHAMIRKSHIALLISAGVLLFSASAVFVELQDSMNTIWGVKPRPHQGIWRFARSRLLSIGMIMCVAFLLVMSVLISQILAGVANQMGGNFAWQVVPLKEIVSFGVEAGVFTLIFKAVPDAKVRWSAAGVGAVVAAVLFTCGRVGLAIYFRYTVPLSLYGATSSLAAILLWVYYSAFSLFFGVEFTKVWGEGREARKKEGTK